MKKLLNTIFILGAIYATFAQTELKRADLYFERAFYSDAIPLYEQLLPRNKSSKLVKNLADSYYRTFDMKAAARWYSYLISNYGQNVDENYHFNLNQSLKAIGKYDEANKVLLDFYAEKNEHGKIDVLKKELVYLENVTAIGQRFEIKNLAINTPTSEFGAAMVDSNLVYSATKKNIGKLYRWNNENYLDIYTHPAHKLTLGDSLSDPISPNINSKLHEGTFAITKDGKTMYFTRNGKNKTDAKKIKNLKIHKAEWIDGDWKNVAELSFNGDGFSTEHPALNSDETKLYFASDRAGGFGSFDLYYVNIQADGHYGNPINLGSTINTDKKEQFPFIDVEGNLYFSSNGHPGYGLLDIFLSIEQQGNFQKPDNLGLPVNSGYDDFSWALNKDGKTGFFSSNRPSGKGSDDIYAFSETKALVIEDCKQFIAGVLTDKTTKKPISKGNVHLFDDNGHSISKVTTAEDGSFHFNISCASNYTLKGSKTNYEDNSKTVATTKERNKTYDGSLDLFSQSEKENQRLAAEKKREDARVFEEQKRKEQKLLADSKAIKEKEENRLKVIKKAIATEDAIVKEKERTVIKTEEIHFDYSLWYLRRETRERLKKVIELMKNYPGMTIEIGSHTDIRGNKDYNRSLSQKRAQSVKDYLVQKGIQSNRIIAKGYGESQPIVKCKTEAECSEEDHEWNRRCEFVIQKWE